MLDNLIDYKEIYYAILNKTLKNESYYKVKEYIQDSFGFILTEELYMYFVCMFYCENYKVYRY